VSEAGPELASCPKCAHPRRAGGDACARCGLVYARWRPDEVVGAVAPLDEAAESLWREALADWANPARHDAFLKHCSLVGQLAAAGRRYRARADADASDALARKMQERVLAMATAALTLTPRPRAPVTRARWFWVVIVVGLVVGMTGAFLARR
jgi:hypothetical protein